MQNREGYVRVCIHTNSGILTWDFLLFKTVYVWNFVSRLKRFTQASKSYACWQRVCKSFRGYNIINEAFHFINKYKTYFKWLNSMN